jgi:hypothetical protein
MEEGRDGTEKSGLWAYGGGGKEVGQKSRDRGAMVMEEGLCTIEKPTNEKGIQSRISDTEMEYLDASVKRSGLSLPLLLPPSSISIPNLLFLTRKISYSMLAMRRRLSGVARSELSLQLSWKY